MLTFKWNAILKNGKYISQFEDSLPGDHRDLLPTQRENSFKLVQDLEKEGKLKRLELVCIEDGKAHIAVDLETGHLVVRGNSFHPYNSLTLEDVKYRVVFFKRFRGHLGSTLQQIGEPYFYRYGIGWQCTLDGKNYQKILYYDPDTADIDLGSKR